MDFYDFHKDIRVVNTFDNPKDIIENFYSTNNIYIIRKKLNLSVKDFADLCGVAEETITKYETTNCNLSVKVIRKIASIINEDIFYIGKYYELPEDNLPEKLYKAMKYHGHTYKDCAKDIGVDPQTISRVLKGHIFKQERIKIGLEKYIDTIYNKKK